MAGHSKWANIKHKKGAADAKRGKLFSRLAREITIAAKSGGGDVSMNPRLRGAVNSAKAQNLASDTIERAIKKGTGELESEAIEELVYEGYGPGGVAILIETATDNKNRTAAEMRHIFSKNNGNLGTSGSVSYLFARKGQITVPSGSITEEVLLDLVIEAGGEEMSMEEEHFIITTPYEQLYEVAEALRCGGAEVESQSLVHVPGTYSVVEDEQAARQIIRLCDALEDNEDVQNVFANYDIPEQMLGKITT